MTQKQNRLCKALIICIFILLILFAQVFLKPYIAELPSVIKRYHTLAIPLFMLVYIIGTILFLPGVVLTLTGGFLFGPWLGGVFSLIAATIGAAIAFIIGRYLAADWVATKNSDLLKHLVAGINDEGWRFVAFVRLVPIFPFNLVNYAFGLTRIPLLVYACTSFICMLPGAMAYSYLGSLGQLSLTSDKALLFKKLAIAFGLVVIVAFLPYFIKKIRRSA